MTQNDIRGELLDWEALVKKINGQAIVLSTVMGSGDVPPDAVWAGELLTDMTKDLKDKYDSLTSDLMER